MKKKSDMEKVNRTSKNSLKIAIAVLLIVGMILLAGLVYVWYYKKPAEIDLGAERMKLACEIYNTTYADEYGVYDHVLVFNLSEIIGEHPMSSEYVIYRFRGHDGAIKAHTSNLFIAVKKDASTVFPINNITNYNKLVSTLNFHVNMNESVNISYLYIQLVTPNHSPAGEEEIPTRSCSIRPSILWELPNETGEENYTTFQEWFNTRNYTFHPPISNFTEDYYTIKYYAWQVVAGYLTYHYIDLQTDGIILTYNETLVGYGTDNYIIP